MTHLLDLPSELIAGIFQHLDDADFFATRLASAGLETASLTLFGRRFFRKKGYMITTPSLDVLQNVASTPKLSKYVQHIWFNPDCYTFLTPDCAPENDIDCDDAENSDEEGRIEITQRVDLLTPKDRARWEAYKEVTEDHDRLLTHDASKLRERLINILSQLPNVKILGMRRSEDHSPWGWCRLEQTIGEDPRVLGPMPSQPVDSLSDSTKLFTCLAAAAASAPIRLQRLYTDAVEVDNIPVNWWSGSNLQETVRSMLYLEINASKAWLPMRSSPHYRVLRDESKYGDGLLKVFEAAAPTLLELGLQIFPEVRRAAFSHGLLPWGEEFWKQRSYQYLTFQKIVENVQFEQLTRLKLEKIITTPELLKGFLLPSADKLISLKIRDIRLLSSPDSERPWETIFAFLLSEMPNLDYLLLYQLLHTHGGISFVEKSALPSAATADADADSPAAQAISEEEDAVYHAYADSELQAFEARGRAGTFREYMHIALEAKGREEVVRTLERVRERHWYEGNVYSYAMDEEVWHTDTSDEEW